MTEARFDILFDGTLRPDTDLSRARERLGTAFKLDAAGVERLFSGKPMTVKRDADAATAARYQRVFEDAGAVVTLRPLTATEPSDTPPPNPALSTPSGADSPPLAAPNTPPLTAEGGFEFLEAPPTVKMPDLDLSYLSLVGGSDWSLADCEQRPERVQIPDISHLRLDEIDATASEHETTAQKPAL